MSRRERPIYDPLPPPPLKDLNHELPEEFNRVLRNQNVLHGLLIDLRSKISLLIWVNVMCIFLTLLIIAGK